MAHTDALPLIVGIPGPALEESHLAVLESVRPAGIVLFARNIESSDQVRQLVDSFCDLDPRPFVCVDLEGGMVNRLAPLWGDLPSPAQAAASGRKAVRALGQAAGAACRALGISLDFAPVVDLERPEGLIARQGRTLSRDTERSSTFARVFADGLAEWNVGGCLKHFPGLGAASVDTHEDLAIIDHRTEDLDAHMGVFAALSADIPVVMIGHVVVPALGDAERPASLSRQVVRLAKDLPGRPVVLSDDIEMGALGGFGAIEDLTVAAFKAQIHGVLICKRFDQLSAVAERLRREADEDSTFASSLEEGRARLGTLARDLCQKAGSIPAPDDATVDQLWQRARREAEALQANEN
jgi:beta-N-acetylhexosaminidase